MKQQEETLLPISSSSSSSSSNSDDEKKDGASVIETALNMLNELEGQGLLGLPYAASLIGYEAAASTLVFVGLLAAYTGYLINGCMYDSTDVKSRNRVSSSYSDLGRRTFGKWGELIVMFVQMTNLCFVGVVYIV